MTPLRAWTEIDLSKYELNLKNIVCNLPENIELISVVKADAYGHGLAQIVERSLQSGIKTFAVANIQEAFELKNVGIGWPVLILGSLLPGEEHLIPGTDFIPTISSIEEFNRLEQVCINKNINTEFHLKIDTGMGRLGIWHKDCLNFISYALKSNYLKLVGLYTHYSSASNDLDYTLLQKQRFQNILDHIDNAKLVIHADSSSSINCLPFDTNYNAVRLGLLQYGILPLNNIKKNSFLVNPILSFYTKVGLIKSLPKGTPISYGKSYKLKRDSKIAILTAGYADGVPLAYSSKGRVLINGEYCSIIGKITMDQTIIDVSNLENIDIGDKVTLIGKSKDKEISIEEYSNNTGTIPWDTLCSITKRVQRIYINNRI